MNYDGERRQPQNSAAWSAPNPSHKCRPKQLRFLSLTLPLEDCFMEIIKIPVEASDFKLPAKEPECNKLFRLVMKHQSSDLHLKVGQPPMMRHKGDIARVDMRPLTAEDMERLLLPNLSPKH